MLTDTLVWLQPGALRATEPQALKARWWNPDGTSGEGTLQQLLGLAPASLVLVLSAADVRITQVTLSRRQARHLQKVLPFLLEESLLSPTEQLWFAHGRPRQGLYPVAACDRQGLEQLLDLCRQAQVPVRLATVDASLLQDLAPVAVCIGEECLWCTERDALLLPAVLLPQLLEAQEDPPQDFTRLDDPDTLVEHFRAGLAAAPLNLLQGELAPQRDQVTLWNRLGPWRPVLATAAVLLVALWGLLAVQTWQYREAARVQQQLAVERYQQLFPGAARPQLLQREFNAQLDRLGTVQGGGFMALVAPVGEVVGRAQAQGVTPRRMQYDDREGALMMDVTARDFATLEQLRDQLQAQGLEAEIGSARTDNQGVSARLKVGRG